MNEWMNECICICITQSIIKPCFAKCGARVTTKCNFIQYVKPFLKSVSNIWRQKNILLLCESHKCFCFFLRFFFLKKILDRNYLMLSCKCSNRSTWNDAHIQQTIIVSCQTLIRNVYLDAYKLWKLENQHPPVHTMKDEW